MNYLPVLLAPRTVGMAATVENDGDGHAREAPADIRPWMMSAARKRASRKAENLQSKSGDASRRPAIRFPSSPAVTAPYRKAR